MEKKLLNIKDIKISLVLTLLSAIGGGFVVLGQIDSIPAEMSAQMTKIQLIVVSIVQVIIMAFVLSFLGLKLARATNLNKGLLGYIYSEKEDRKGSYKINSKNLLISILAAFVYAGITVLSEKFIWIPNIPELGGGANSFDLMYLLSGVIYGGIFEEIMLRLFVMSLVVFILYKIFAGKKDKYSIPSSIYWIAIIIAGLLFGLGHLPATLAMFGTINSIIISRMMILNGIAAIIFGWLYWKKGIEYAMIAHMFSHVFMQLIWLPILF